jgi:hypothetical protein
MKLQKQTPRQDVMIAMSERMRMLLEGRGKLSRETPRVKCVLNILIISCARLRISSLVLNVYVVPLSKLQSRLLSLLAGKRSPDSYVAGGIAINRDGPRFSADIDIFQDDVEQLVAIAESDAATIIEAGFVLTWLSSRSSSILAHFNPTEPLTKAERLRSTPLKRYSTRSRR